VATQAASQAPTTEQFRGAFHKELDALVEQVRDMGAGTHGALERAMEAFAAEDVALCDTVIAGDDALDGRFAGIQREVLRLIARQAPVASDARLLTAAMQIALHLERIGDLAVNVAELTKRAAGLPRDPKVLRDLEEMGATTLGMVDEAMRAFSDRDADACLRLPLTDDRVDALNLARQLERAGDHAVDIGEQVWFMVTGELRELTSPARVRGE